MRIVCISDTHARHAGLVVPDGDVLVHAGDLTRRGSEKDVRAFDDWLRTLPHRHKVVIAGNHDFCFENRDDARTWITAAHYLQDSGVTLDGVRFWGSPWQPRFFDWAFNLDRGASLRAKWNLIPAGTDVLITHGPPEGILDRCADGQEVGCADLLDAVRRVRPKLHVFGHIHEAYGRVDRGTVFVNASTCNLEYKPVQAPIVVEI
jgi:Icc-related predicted phosphoesterase